MPSGTAEASSGAMSDRPWTTSPPGNGRCSASAEMLSPTLLGWRMSDQPRATATQATAVETRTASRPTGASNGGGPPPSQPTRMKASATNAIHGATHICAAGLIEMNVMLMPASEPSSAARGVNLRMYGPKSAPSRTMQPMMNAQANPARQAFNGSWDWSSTGSMTTNTTMNVCGTLGP